LSVFPNLEKIFISHFVDENKLEIKDIEKYKDKIIKLVNAQKFLEEYLEKNYSGKQKSEITGTLCIDDKNLEGELKVEGLSELERLDCDTNKLTSLEIINCPKLKMLYCYSNQLSELELDNLNDLTELSCYGNNLTNCDFVKQLNPKKLTLLSIRDNDFTEQSLEIFSDFVNLETLRLENTDKERIEKGVYNRFYGSLEHLKGISKLKKLGISNTDLDSGVEHLPDNIKEIYCSVEEKPDAEVKKIKEQLDSLLTKITKR